MLRTETASLAAISALQILFWRFGIMMDLQGAIFNCDATVGGLFPKYRGVYVRA